MFIVSLIILDYKHIPPSSRTFFSYKGGKLVKMYRFKLNKYIILNQRIRTF